MIGETNESVTKLMLTATLTGEGKRAVTYRALIDFHTVS